MRIMPNTVPEANLLIDGFPFYVEGLQPVESFERRDIVRTKVMNGTEVATQGDWIPKEFNVQTSIEVAPNQHDIHDNTFKKMMSKPCEIICPEMGDIFKAQVIIKKSPVSGGPRTLNLDINIKQIADTSDFYTSNALDNFNRMKIS